MGTAGGVEPKCKRCGKERMWNSFTLKTGGVEYGPYCFECFNVRSEDNLRGVKPPENEKMVSGTAG